MPEPTSTTGAALVTKAANVATFGGSGSALFFGLTANEFAALSGVAIAIIGLAVNVYFKAQHLRIARQRAEADPEE